MWLDERRGHAVDWTTQRWVQLTGRRVDLRQETWLGGPIGKPSGIGPTVFEDLAREQQLALVQDGPHRGLLPSLDVLDSPQFDPARVNHAVRAFYERTSEYSVDAWSQWCGAFRPFGGIVASLFSRRLQQLNVPLSGLDTSRGMTSEVMAMIHPATQVRLYATWVRQLLGTGHVIYAGAYSACAVPGYDGQCVKVVFPLPNGNAIVVMKPVAHPDGSLSLVSAGGGFGEPGFYFTVQRQGDEVWARYLRALRETIHVYAADDGSVRADHVLRLWGATFLRLHYRLTRMD
jgi:hypothetical protein